MEPNPQLAMVCFGIAVAALLWVYRRTLLRQRPGGSDAQDAGSYASRRHQARRQIADITCREWLTTYRRSAHIPRTLPLSSANQQLLGQVTQSQAG